MKSLRAFGIVAVCPAAWVLPVSAAPSDELVGEQAYDIHGSPDAEGSFWDPAFWRDTTDPVETPIIPGTQNYLYFRSKNYLGEPMAAPATGMTLKTGAALGFSPPVVPPALARVFFSDNVLRFDGAPDVPGGAFGRMIIANPHLLQLESASSVDFDRTLVETNRAAIYSRSGIQVTGDVTASGGSTNFSNPGFTTIERTGAGSVSPFLVRQGAVATLGSVDYTFALHPLDPNTGNAPVFRAESGASLVLTNAVLHQPTGVVFDADASAGASSIVLGGGFSSGTHVGADPLTVFRATGDGSGPVTPSIQLTGAAQFNDLTGTFARASQGALIAFNGQVALTNADNLFRVVAESGGKVEFSEINTTYFATSGTARLEWSADDGGLIDAGPPVGGFLHCNGGSHTAVATDGGEIRMIPNIGVDSGGTVGLQALGAGSVVSFPYSLSLEPWEDNNPLTPPGTFGQFAIEARNGASLVGGSLVSEPWGDYVDMRSVAVLGNAGTSTFTLENASASYLNVIFDSRAQVAVGGASGSTLRHVHFNVGSDSSVMVNGGTWRPISADTLFNRQDLVLGGGGGGSAATITGAALAHEVDVQIGQGTFADLGVLPPFAVCTLTVNGGSTWTGALDAASFPSGRATVLMSGAGTSAGLRHANLGASAYPSFQGMGMPEFSGNFFINPGGDADLTVSAGARLAVGCYVDAFGTWTRPTTFTPPWMVCNGSDIHIDATSAVYMGDADSPATVDYRNGALVVGVGGYLLGTGTVHGTAAGGNDLVLAGGSIAPGFSPGRLAVEGGFRMESGTLVMEVESAGPGGFDQMAADQIAMVGGTLRIVPGAGFTPGASFPAQLFDTLSLSVGPGVLIEIDPAFGSSTFDPLTGVFSVVVSGGGDANGNGIPDIVEEVLPAQGSGVEWPVVIRNPSGASVYQFRRKDASENNRSVVAQWSTSLSGWTDIPVAAASSGVVTVTENGTDPDLIEVVLPDPSGQSQFFVRLKVE